jgi:hypothetical protein
LYTFEIDGVKGWGALNGSTGNRVIHIVSYKPPLDTLTKMSRFYKVKIVEECTMADKKF